MARPSIFSESLATEICNRLASGQSLRSICQNEGMPHCDSVLLWLHQKPEFSVRYARARETWADSEFERMMEIADTVLVGEKTKTFSDGKTEVTTGDMVERARLQVDTRKWALARMSPKKYGDRVLQQLTGADGETLKIEVTGIRPTKENT